MAQADKFIDDSIASAVPGASILGARQVSQKAGGPLYALVHVYGAGAAGVFTGSVQLEASPPGRNTFAIVGAAITAPGAQSVLVPADADYRFNATALSANGPLACFMALPA